MKKIFYAVVFTLLLTFITGTGWAQMWGTYTVYGIKYTPFLTYPYKTVGHLSNTDVGDRYEAFSGESSFSFGIDSGQVLTDWQPGGRTPANSGFMTQDNPGGFSYYPGNYPGYTSDVYNNTFDSVAHTLYAHYGYTDDTVHSGEAFYSTQVYEKWVLNPVLDSFNPSSGQAGTVVTLRGTGFRNMTQIRFNDVSANFTIISDNEIQVIAPASSSGSISIIAGGYGVSTAPGNGFLYVSTEPNLLAPRTTQGLYSEGDTTNCHPWIKDYPNWTSLTTADSLGTQIEIETQFQDEPGNLCGFESYIDSSPTYRQTVFGTWTALLSPRNYRIRFSNSNFTHLVGVRLFGRTAEIDELLKQAGSGYPESAITVFRYDGPNEDYLPGNNTNGGTVYNDSAHGIYNTYSYTFIRPAIYYYGANNEYYYMEFYTDHFSEFYSGITLFSILPLNLTSFSASVQDKTASVTWQTSNEVNTSFFTVQRSTDGVHFTSLGKVNAAGTGGNHSYSYQDNLSGITATKVYYRLQITDKDGSVKTSSIVSVDLADRKLITIQPNPARNYAVVTCNVSGRKTITVTDMNGRQVFIKTTANSSDTISLSAFAKGMYIVRVAYAGGISIQKLLVE